MDENKLRTIEDYLEKKPSRLFDLKFSQLTQEEIVRLATKVISTNPYNQDMVYGICTLPLDENKQNILYYNLMKEMNNRNGIPIDIPQQMKDFMKHIGLDFAINNRLTINSINNHNRYISFGLTEIPQDFRTMCNNSTVKPTGGLWACDYIENGEFHSKWEEWSTYESFHLERLKIGMIFSIDPQAKVLTINSKKDIENILEKYSMQSFYDSVDENTKRILISFGFNTKAINWSDVGKEYDVVVFTESGQFFFDHQIGIGCAQLDVPCIVVSNPDVIVDIEPYYAEQTQEQINEENVVEELESPYIAEMFYDDYNI